MLVKKVFNLLAKIDCGLAIRLSFSFKGLIIDPLFSPPFILSSSSVQFKKDYYNICEIRLHNNLFQLGFQFC